MPFLIIRPLKPLSFRWGGEFSPALSGPMNRGVSEPLPLPSTVTGFLYSITKGGGKEVRGGLSLEEDLRTVGSKVWGPLLRVGDDYYAHSYPGRLIRVTGWRLGEEVSVGAVLAVVNRIGIGLRFDTKNAMEHMIYSQQLVKVRDGGIVVEVGVDVKEGYYTMGGEGGLVRVEPIHDVRPPDSGDEGLVLSPVIMAPRDGVRSVEDLYDMEVEGCGRLGDIAVSVKVGLIGLGFNLTHNVRRPIYPAIMPGSRLRCNRRGNIGLFRDYGWGSVLPVAVPK